MPKNEKDQTSQDSQALYDRLQSDSARKTKEVLAAQPKKTVRLYQRPKGEVPLPDVFVGINGHNFQIQRGIPVDVPEAVYEILMNSSEM